MRGFAQHLNRHAEKWVLALGVLLRLGHFLESRSLWLDESWVAVSIASRSFGEILLGRPMMPEFPQPPLIFFVFEKMSVVFLGNNEMALRLFPFLTGILALILFYRLFRKFLCRRDLILALVLFSVAGPLIYYSAEVKQYSSDLCVALGLLLFLERWLSLKAISRKDAFLLALVGAGALWISYSSAFLLIAFAIVIFLRSLWRRQRSFLYVWGATVFFWFMSFLLLYKISLSLMDHNASLKGMWKGAMLTAPFFSFETLSWTGKVFGDALRDPAALTWPILGGVLFLLGIAAFFQRDRWRTLLFLLPIGITLLASMLGKYPFYGRMLLFLVPIFYFFIAVGAGFLTDKLHRGRKIVWSIAFVLLIAPSFFQTFSGFFHGHSRADNRQVLQFFMDHYEPGDFVYMNTAAQSPFWYYAGSLGFGKMFPQEVLGVYQGKVMKAMRIGKFARATGTDVAGDFLAFRYEYNRFDDQGLFQGTYGLNKDRLNIGKVYIGKNYPYPDTGRTWLFLSAGDDYDNELDAMIRDSFDRHGDRIRFFEARNAAVFLYDMSKRTDGGKEKI